MSKYLISAAIAAVAIGATPAIAGAPQGPRVELRAGADILRQKIPGVFSPSVKLDDTGVLYGIGAGYDFAINDGISIGIDAAAERSTAKLEKRFLGVGNDVTIDTDCEEVFFCDLEYTSKPRWNFFIGPRVSFSTSERSNFYINAGYDRAGFRQTLRLVDEDTGDTLESIRGTNHVGGWRIGAGGQVDMSRNIYLGGEFNYADLKDDYSRINAVLLVGFRFGAPVEPVYVAPAPLPPAPMPEAAPATQTCADGSVILATDMCPPPPAPAPVPERG